MMTVKDNIYHYFSLISYLWHFTEGFNSKALRVISIVKIDYKKGGVTMDEKVGKYR